MAQIDPLLELLRTLILSTCGETIKISRDTLSNIKVCLQYEQEKIDVLQLETQLQKGEIQKKIHHYEPIFFQNIEKNSHQQQEIF